MVNLADRLKKIIENYVDDGSYLVINKGRQYGKTTTLKALEKYLKDDYTVLSLDFQKVSTESFKNDITFSHAFEKINERIWLFGGGRSRKNEGTVVGL